MCILLHSSNIMPTKSINGEQHVKKVIVIAWNKIVFAYFWMYITNRGAAAFSMNQVTN